MASVVIENPVINSPFVEPQRYFRIGEQGITNEIIAGRRRSEYFSPIPQARKRGAAAQMAFDTEWTQDRVEENRFINQVRDRVARWRTGGYVGITNTTRRLLDYWTNPERERKLFFCQIEALETAIYVLEVADKYGDAWITANLHEYNKNANPGLFRIAFKMATGSGKTVVMAMLIAWHALNKMAAPQDARFADSFLLVTPGITIRDRLRVLLPGDPQNYYQQRDILPSDLFTLLGQAKIVITNYHAFKQRELGQVGELTKRILTSGTDSPFKETPAQMVNRVCREFGSKRNIIVINDEAHHCYRRRPDDSDLPVEQVAKLAGEDKQEADKRENEARVWITGLEAVKRKLGVRAIYDLSATPFFLRGSGYPEGTLFPWVVSDFSLIDAIESGVVKVPRVPVSDDSMTGDLPTYRELWSRIRDDLPKRRTTKESDAVEPKLPAELEGALHSLYSNYEKFYARWKAASTADGAFQTPPVLIVVCNNTMVSRMVYDYIAGWTRTLPDGTTRLVPGHLPLFSNVADEHWLARPNTILIDSEQLESGEAMSAEFKKIAAREIAEFKEEYRARFPGKDAESITDEDVLREVMNTVGKPSKLGEQVKCVVSVSMLTEGWDANTVTHILGVRAFRTQLLCEQVVGRGLRRMDYTPDAEGMFAPEYAEVYGVPFSFIPTNGTIHEPKPGRMPMRVRALEERQDTCEITFPRLVGYRYELPSERVQAHFTAESALVLSTQMIPTSTIMEAIVGAGEEHTLDDLKARREQEVAFFLAKFVLERKFAAADGLTKPWLFPQLLGIVRRWLPECVHYKDNTFVQLLLVRENAEMAATRIFEAIVSTEPGQKRIVAVLRPFEPIGQTRDVDFTTIRPTYKTDPAKCHISHVVADTDTWEQKMAQALEGMAEVIAYVKNDHLGFTIPYNRDGTEHSYIPDFIVRLDDGQGRADPLNLILEVTGEKRPDKVEKVNTARDLWLPAVNAHGGFGRWAFLEIRDPWDALNAIRAELRLRHEMPV